MHSGKSSMPRNPITAAARMSAKARGDNFYLWFYDADMKSALKALNVRLEKSLMKRMQRDAKQRGMSIQAWIDGAVTNELARRKWEDEKLKEIRKSE